MQHTRQSKAKAQLIRQYRQNEPFLDSYKETKMLAPQVLVSLAKENNIETKGTGWLQCRAWDALCAGAYSRLPPSSCIVCSWTWEQQRRASSEPGGDEKWSPNSLPGEIGRWGAGLEAAPPKLASPSFREGHETDKLWLRPLPARPMWIHAR